VNRFFLRAAIAATLFLSAACGPVAFGIPGATPRHEDGPDTDDDAGTFYRNRGYGTDVYAGPFDALFNKGFAVAQWENRNRAIFDHSYGWDAVFSSLTAPGAAVARSGGWREVLLVHAMPFYYGGYRDPQWVPNYFGHVVEGGMVYRRLTEWNESRGVPLPRVAAALVTYGSAMVNEAYETPPPADGTPQVGNAGLVMDLMVFDPLGILLFSSEGVAHAVKGLGVSLWPSQGSLVAPSGRLENNGESVVFKLPLPWTRHRFFLRTGMGLEGGLSWQRRDGLDVSVSAGLQSYERRLDPDTYLEEADFAWSGGVWLDRDDVLLASLTVDTRTDRRVGVNLYPGMLQVGGVGMGMWMAVDAAGRPYLGITGHTLGLGAGIGF
jgi:hypothetical protein